MNAGFQKDIGFGCVRLANTPLLHLTLVPRYISEIDNIFTTRPAFFAKTALDSRRRKSTEDSYAYDFDDNASSPKKHRTIKSFQPKTENQKAFLELMRDDEVDIIIAIGPAGTGKTMLACYAAIEAIRLEKVNKIVITRPVVSVDEDIGFLPGSLESKMDPWTRPIFDTLRETYSAKEIEKMMEEGIIEIVPLGFMRGRTFKNTWIIADEMQNSSPTQMFMLATRIGEGSKMIITGDLNQSDLNPRHNGLLEIYNKVYLSERRHGANCVRYVELDKEDVQRSRAAKKILDIYEMDVDGDDYNGDDGDDVDVDGMFSGLDDNEPPTSPLNLSSESLTAFRKYSLVCPSIPTLVAPLIRSEIVEESTLYYNDLPSPVDNSSVARTPEQINVGGRGLSREDLQNEVGLVSSKDNAKNDQIVEDTTDTATASTAATSTASTAATSTASIATEWIEIENDAALIPLKHINQLKKLR
jgi:phosphate starvation-inducible PhoH-like protein